MCAILYVEYNNAIPTEEIFNCLNDVKITRLDNNTTLPDNNDYVSFSNEYDVEYKNKIVLQIRKNGRYKWKITVV